jgi:hypothetical protein
MPEIPAAAVRFVPEQLSLVDDAPGWEGPPALVSPSPSYLPDDSVELAGSCSRVDTTTAATLGPLFVLGPVCWKCRGNGTTTKSKRVKLETKTTSTCCVVCQGHGRLRAKHADTEGARVPGTITRGRRRPVHWQPWGPEPYAFTKKSKSHEANQKWIQLVQKATNEQQDETIGIRSLDRCSSLNDTTNAYDRAYPPGDVVPGWIPRPGEQLCNLVGSWRILQRVGSHRWTTDDLCTAYWALESICRFRSPPPRPRTTHFCDQDDVEIYEAPPLRYLDLGTGNVRLT